MSAQDFEFEDFADNFNMEDEISSEWPSLSVELTMRWHPAEPDVGIFEAQPELAKVLYFLDGDTYADEDSFVSAVYARIGDEIEETVEAVAKAIRDQVDEWASTMEDE